jgi:hypothetical protein
MAGKYSATLGLQLPPSYKTVITFPTSDRCETYSKQTWSNWGLYKDCYRVNPRSSEMLATRKTCFKSDSFLGCLITLLNYKGYTPQYGRWWWMSCKGCGNRSLGLLQCTVTDFTCRRRKIMPVDHRFEISAQGFKDSKERYPLNHNAT